MWHAKNLRFYVLLSGVVLAMLLLILALLHIQLNKRDFLADAGKARSIRTEAVVSQRGTIFDRHKSPLAMSAEVIDISVDPKIFKPTPKQRLQISQILEIPSQKIIQKSLLTKTRFAYLKQNVEPQIYKQIKALAIKGILYTPHSKRFYPASHVASHIVGFTDTSSEGIVGMELKYNDLLKSVDGSKKVIKDVDGNIIKEMGLVVAPIEGQNLILSIDLTVQYITYKHLAQAVQYHHAQSGSAIVIKTETGEILSMVNHPTFNPNNRKNIQFADLRNRAVTDIFEPGSVVKPFTMAKILTSTNLTIDSKIDTSPGYIKVDNHTIRDIKKYGTLSLSQILSKSSNVGTAKLSLMLDKYALINWFDDLGFGQKVTNQILGEKKGILPLAKRFSNANIAALSYGYGLSTTLLKLSQLYTVLANNGVNTPLSIIANPPAAIKEQIIDKRVAQQIRNSLIQAVSTQGTGASAQVQGFSVAGKTGTTHKFKKGSGYTSHQYRATFIGMLPADKPQYVIAVMIDSPQGNEYYGGEVAAPVFANIATELMRRN